MERIGPYEVLGEVARGGMGVVYKGRQPDLDRPVAIKVLLAGRGATEVARKRFLREAQALARLSHRHIVRVFDVEEHQGAPYMVQEWVDGESLQERLGRAGQLPLREALQVARDLAGALAHAHAQGVLHRDLKPANVLLRTGSGQAVLTDFGLTRDLDPSLSQTALSVRGRFMGTPGYWPPEQARGESDRIGPWSDVYALGATVYAALTGSPPHGEPVTLLEAVACLDQDPEPPSRLRPEVPAGLDAILLRCLAREPEQRYAGCDSLCEHLTALLEGRSTPAGRRARSPLLMVWGAAGTVGLGIVLGAAAVSGVASLEGILPFRRSDREAEQARERALERLRQGDSEGALVEFNRALELRPDSFNDLKDRGILLASRGDAAGAIADLTRALELQPKWGGSWYNLGVARAQQGDLSGAIRDFTRAIELQPDHLKATFNRGLARYGQGDQAGAVADFSRVLELEPDHVDALYNRTLAYMKQGSPRLATGDLTRLIELGPPSADAHLKRAVARQMCGDDPGTIEDCTRALALAPNDARVYSLRGVARDRQGDLTGAIADYTRSIELQPDDVMAWLSRARARGDQGDLLGAIADFNRVLELDPDLAEVWCDRGRVREHQRDLEGAAADYSRALALEPEAPWAAETRERLARLRR